MSRLFVCVLSSCFAGILSDSFSYAQRWFFSPCPAVNKVTVLSEFDPSNNIAEEVTDEGRAMVSRTARESSCYAALVAELLFHLAWHCVLVYCTTALLMDGAPIMLVCLSSKHVQQGVEAFHLPHWAFDTPGLANRLVKRQQMLVAYYSQ